MLFYVVGGMYENTKFARLIKPEPSSGPFATYEAAYEAWSARSRASLDFATVRFRIVAGEQPPEVA